MNRLEGEKQNLKLDSFNHRQPVKLSQCWSYMAEFIEV